MLKVTLKNCKQFIRKLLSRKVYSLISISEIPEANCISRRYLFEEKRLYLYKPNVITGFGNSNAGKTITEEITIPAIELLELANCSFIGGFNAIIANEFFAVPDCMNIKSDVFRAEMFGVANVDTCNKKISIASPKRPHHTVEKAICILGECYSNYAHFMLEILPRMLLLDQLKEYKHLPLIFDTIPDKFVEVLKEFGLYSRKIFQVKAWQYIRIKRCITLTSTSYTPAENRNFLKNQILNTPSIDNCFFSPDALKCLRESLGIKCLTRPSTKLICLIRVILRVKVHHECAG